MSDALPLPPGPELEEYEKLAKDLQRACKLRDGGAIREWAARWAGDGQAEGIEQRWEQFKQADEGAARCTLAGAQFFLAREHGFASWPKFAEHLEALARAGSMVSNFEAAADAIVSGDLSALEKLLSGNPELVRARSTREHRSTLLHYVSANGIEDFRQKTPENILEIAKTLLDAGADVNAESDAYGGGSTTLGLTATSVHPERAGVQIALLQMLLDHGARIDQPSTIKACLANGQPGAAEFLASRGAPVDFEEAAGLGRLDLVKRYFDAATEAQAQSGFLYACGYGRKEVVEFLLDRGVDPGCRNAHGQTGLHWAAYGSRVDVVKLLLERGAPVDVRDERFHATPLDVALHVRCDQVVALLRGD